MPQGSPATTFADTRALVTGASRGIGAAIARSLCARGAQVAITARSTKAQPSKVPGTLDEVLSSIEAMGGRAVAVQCDLTDESSVLDMADEACDLLGGLDIVVNNAAVAFPGDLDISAERLRRMIAVNVRAPMLIIDRVSKELRKSDHGRILNISSATATYAIEGLGAYGMSKVALEHLTVVSSQLLRRYGISVNCFRVDIGVASEGMAFRTSGEAAHWEPCEVAAEGVLWVLAQPTGYSGHLVSMSALRAQEGIMRSEVQDARTPSGAPIFPGAEYST